MEKTLTKAEEQVMLALWKINKGFLREILESMKAPVPHSNTVATILKILIDKGFVGTETFGRMNRYYPLYTREQYSKGSIKGLVKNYFEGDFSGMVSFMLKEKNLSITDLEALLKEVKKK